MTADSQETQAQRQDEDSRQESQSNGKDGGGGSITQELKDAVREAALEVLRPAARQATSAAAKFAVKKGPELVTEKAMPSLANAGGLGGLAQQAISKGGEALSQSGGVGGIAGKLMSKVGGGGGGGEASGWGRNRRMPVQQVIYVSVPVRDAYNGWTEYKRWPQYMHRANQVDAEIGEQEARIKITEKMWGFTRPFTAEIVEQRPDEHIKWNSTDGTKHTGVINFHELGPRLTLIELSLDHSPSGLAEKVARGARFVKRAVRADFHRFQGWIEMKSEQELDQLEGWRGTIEDGQIVKSHEDALEEEGRHEDGDDREPEGEHGEDGEARNQQTPEDREDDAAGDEYDDEPEGREDDAAGDEYDDEPEGSEDDQLDDEYEAEPEGQADDEEPEAAEQPHRRRQRTRRRSGDKEESRRAPRRDEPRRRRTPAGGGQRGPEATSGERRRRRAGGERSSR